MRNVDYLIMLERRENIIVKKTEDFGDRIIKLHKYLLGKREGNVDILKQVLRSGTSIGANVSEGQYAQTKADFLTKMSIALKEAFETKYWLLLLHESNSIDDASYESINNDLKIIVGTLTKIIKKKKGIE